MTTAKERSDLDDSLKKLDCPFTWDMEAVLKDEKAEKKYHENDDEDLLPLLKLIRKITTAHVLTETNGDRDEILDILKDCKNDLCELEDTPDSEISVDVAEYVYKATKCHVYHKFDMKDEMNKTLEEIKDVKFTSNKDESTLKACRALCWSKYHRFGSYEAEKYIREAIDKNPNCALWYFILAKNLRRQRRDSSIAAKPSKEEMSNFVKAMEMSKNIVFELFLAQVYRENDDTYKALQLYENVFKKNPKETTILLRLALGFIRLRSYQKAKICLDKVGEKIPEHSMYLHYYGIYHMKLRSFKEAIPYYEKAIKDHNISAEKDLLQCLIKDRRNPDVIKYLSNMIDKYNYLPEKQLQTFILDLGFCYWKKRNDLNKALEHFAKAVDIDPKARCFVDYFDFMNLCKRERNVIQILKKQFLPLVYNRKSQFDNQTLEKADKLQKMCDEHYSNFVPGMEETLNRFKF